MPAQANSIGIVCKHFFPCDEGSGSTITDIVNGVVIDGIKSDINVSVGDANAMRLLSWPNVDGDAGTDTCDITGSWVNPNGKDVVIMACGKARDGGVANGGGHLSFYFGDATANGQLKIQPYYAVFSGDSPTYTGGMATLRDADYVTRTNGQDYIFGAVMRGDTLEHWADGSMTDSKSIRDADSYIQAAWDSFNPDGKFKCGHSVANGNINVCQSDGTLSIGGASCDYSYTGYSVQPDGDKEHPGSFTETIGSTEIAQDYYGLVVFVFENGAPDDVGAAMDWMKAEWTKGNKVIYPGWVSLV